MCMESFAFANVQFSYHGGIYMFCALIMAGGKGTRFWPKSTEETPKQFLNLIADKKMIQLTYER